MRKLPYDNFDAQEFILRDWLALDRTVLANERTFLAYGRTSLGLFLSGVTLIKVFKSEFRHRHGLGLRRRGRWGFPLRFPPLPQDAEPLSGAVGA